MQYQFVKEQQDYSDLASGKVFLSLPGHPAFPVRLASEIFQRCVTWRESIYQNASRCILYDPCCGAAYHLSILAYLHRELIQEVIGSDVDEKAVALAKRNLDLVNISGLDKRILEVAELYKQYGKTSHQEALQSARELRSHVLDLAKIYPINIRAFQANAIESKEISEQISVNSVDIVFTDIPYGKNSFWSDPERIDPIQAMLSGLNNLLSDSSIVAISSNKAEKIKHEQYQRIEHFRIGKRLVTFLRPL